MFYTLLGYVLLQKGMGFREVQAHSYRSHADTQYGLGCQERHCLGCHFILSHVREKHI